MKQKKVKITITVKSLFTNFMFNINNLKTLHCYVYIFDIYVYYISEF